MSCGWPGSDEKMIAYHDTEWGNPVHDDLKWFEFITLDGFQAGLSWRTVLNKRENFRIAFHGFDPKKIAKMTDADVERLKQDAGIIRNGLKIKATIKNAQAFLKIQEREGSFDKYIWQFTNGKMIVNQRTKDSEIQATSPESDAMSKALKKEGFTFVGSTICYAFMQAAGMVNDHLVDCPRHKQVQEL